jgi:hypothetical protein
VRWEPILRRDLAIAARDRVSTLAAELARLEWDASAVDLCERALLYGYLGFFDSHGSALLHVAEYLNAATARVTKELPSGFCNGLSGIGWTIHHLRSVLESPSNCDSESREDPLEELDHVILLRLRRDRWPGPYDFIAGLVGIGVFFLERLPLLTACEGISLVLGHLEGLAEESRLGITWHTPAGLLPEHQRRACPKGHYNLGVAHGVPGVVYLLSESIAAGIETARAERLLEGSVKWLLAQQQPAHVLSRYGYWIPSGETETRVSRVAWCYGDLGIAAILYHVARRLGRTDLLRFACSLLDRCLNRSIEHIEPSLCHGAFGIAHIFNRIYQAELKTRYRDAAIRYYKCGLSLMQDLSADIPETGGNGMFEGSFPLSRLGASFLEGTIGVALALLSAVEPIEPQWDRRLILSGCSRHRKN